MLKPPAFWLRSWDHRWAAPTGLREPDNPRNLYSGELRILAADRYAGYPLRGVSVEVMWSRNGISVNTARTSTDEMGFGRVALAPIQRLDTPYDAVSVKLSLPGYPAVYQEQPIHWRLIGPLPSGAEEWRFDVEIYAGL